MKTANENRAITESMIAIGIAAKRAARILAGSRAEMRDAALRAAAAAIIRRSDEIIAANKKDMNSARLRNLPHSMLDRLALDTGRIESMAAGIVDIAELPDPLGKTLAEWDRPNGLRIQRVSVPLGVIGIIYESRPNVTADAAALCLKSGNAVILRGGSESFHSNHIIHACILDGLISAGVTPEAIQIVPTTDRDAVGYLLSSMNAYVDVVIPRGGKRLIKRVLEEARVPVIGHLEGICHVYLHASADIDMARQITLNAKLRRTGICGAAETLLVDAEAADRFLPVVCGALIDAGCEVRGDESVCALVTGAVPATGEDWSTEYLDAIISVKVVADIDAAMAHISQFGSGHTECIVASSSIATEQFFSNVDSAILLCNASTQFADGGEFGMGAEIGIATSRIHARGPVGAEQLTSYKYIVRGSGQTRP